MWKGTEEKYARVLADFGKEDLWSATRLAQAISAVVSIKDEKDYLLVRNNHSQNIVAVDGVTTQFGVPGGRDGDAVAGRRARGPVPRPARRPVQGRRRCRAGGAPVSGATEFYRVNSSSMRVKVEFKRIPIFLRRLLSNSWRYRV